MEANPPTSVPFRQKLPGLLIEGASVAFAVLLALAVDEWRETRSNVELAERATQSVMEEVRTNLERLEDNAEARDSLRAYLALTRELLGQDSVGSINVNFVPAFLANTAWETARVTQAVHFMDYDRVARIGRLYAFQELYMNAEEGFVELLAGIADANWDEPVKAIRIYERGFARVDGFADNLEDLYRVSLERGFEGTDEDEEMRTVEFGR